MAPKGCKRPRPDDTESSDSEDETASLTWDDAATAMITVIDFLRNKEEKPNEEFTILFSALLSAVEKYSDYYGHSVKYQILYEDAPKVGKCGRVCGKLPLVRLDPMLRPRKFCTRDPIKNGMCAYHLRKYRLKHYIS